MKERKIQSRWHKFHAMQLRQRSLLSTDNAISKLDVLGVPSGTIKSHLFYTGWSTRSVSWVGLTDLLCSTILLISSASPAYFSSAQAESNRKCNNQNHESVQPNDLTRDEPPCSFDKGRMPGHPVIRVGWERQTKLTNRADHCCRHCLHPLSHLFTR